MRKAVRQPSQLGGMHALAPLSGEQSIRCALHQTDADDTQEHARTWKALACAPTLPVTCRTPDDHDL